MAGEELPGPRALGEKPPSEKPFKCSHCPSTFENVGELGKHLWTPKTNGGHRETMLELQKKGREQKTAEEAKKKAMELAKGKGAPTPPGEKPSIYKGELDSTAILRGILESHPDISNDVMNEILSWANYQPLTPQSVAYLLTNMKGVASQTANIVAQKYSLALQRAQLEAMPGQMQILPQVLPQQQQQLMGPGQGFASRYPLMQTPQQQQPGVIQPQPFVQLQQPTGYPQIIAQPQFQQPGVTKEDVKQMLKENREATEKETTLSVIKESQEQTRKLLEKIEKGELFPKPPSSTTPPPTKEEIAAMVDKAATDAAVKVIEVKSKEDREERRHHELLSAVKSGSGKVVEGYREDSARILGQSIKSATDVIAGRQPIKIILEKVPELLYGPSQLPKEIPPGAEATPGLLGRLKPEWISES